MDQDQLRRLKQITTPKTTKYMVEEATPKQTAFLLLDNFEVFYGGAAGGGKSSALLSAALQYVDVPRYSAIIFRRTFGDLTLPGALMDRARMWLSRFPEVRWVDKEKTWVWPNGARLAFGYLEHENDKYRYQSAEFQFVGFDELTQFSETQYRFLFSRLRRLKTSKVPIRMRSASNPGGTGHEWVKRRFIDEGIKKGRIFVPASLTDNPYLDQDEYDRSLSELDPVTRAQLQKGDWDVRAAGNMFKREWFDIVDKAPLVRKVLRYWDMASTEEHKRNKDPDWTVGLKLGEINGTYYILDVVRFRARPGETEQRMLEVAHRDGRYTSIWVEQEPGASGAYAVEHVASILKGFPVRGNRSTGSKVLRANPVSAKAERRQIKLVRGSWIGTFFDEAEAFPGGLHDDIIDALSGASDVIGSSVNLTALPIEVGQGDDSYWEYAL